MFSSAAVAIHKPMVTIVTCLYSAAGVIVRCLLLVVPPPATAVAVAAVTVLLVVGAVLCWLLLRTNAMIPLLMVLRWSNSSKS